MAKKTAVKTKTQSVRSGTAYGHIKIGGSLLGGKNGKYTYLILKAPDGTVDEIHGQRLYRLAKAICRRFETASKN